MYNQEVKLKIYLNTDMAGSQMCSIGYIGHEKQVQKCKIFM